MRNTRTPFGPTGRGPDVVWPAYTGPSLQSRTYRPTELWEREIELFVGETVLADLGPGTDCTEALLILGRYQTVRIVIHAGRGESREIPAGIERAAACDYLDAIPDATECRWLRATLDSILPTDDLTPATLSRLRAAAAAASRRGHVHGAFALHLAAYEIARSRAWHRAAARVARAIAGTAAAGNGERSRRRWSRRARVHERHAD